MSTNTLSAKDIKRNWHLIDAKGKILGRLATDVANKLSGKNKVAYVPYLDAGDYVVITNAKHVKVTGKKLQQKNYYRHSGFPGGFKQETLGKLLDRRPEEVIRHAVKGMLPKTRLGDRMIIKLHIFAENEHTFTKQLSSKQVSGEVK